MFSLANPNQFTVKTSIMGFTVLENSGNWFIFLNICYMTTTTPLWVIVLRDSLILVLLMFICGGETGQLKLGNLRASQVILKYNFKNHNRNVYLFTKSAFHPQLLILILITITHPGSQAIKLRNILDSCLLYSRFQSK